MVRRLQQRKNWCSALFIALLVFCGLLVGYFAHTNSIAFNETIPRIRAWIPLESNGFLYFALQYPLTGWGDDIELRQDVCNFTALELRGLTWTFGLLALVALYRLGVRLQGKLLGLCAAFAFAMHATWMAAASYARFYTLNYLFIILALHGLLNVCERGTFRAWLGYALACLGMVSSMILSVSLLPLHLLLFAYWRNAPPRKRQGQPQSWWRFGIVLALVFSCVCFWMWRDPDGKSRFGYGGFGWHSAGIVARALLANGFNSDCINPDVFSWEKAPKADVNRDIALTFLMGAATLVVWCGALWPEAGRGAKLVTVARLSLLGLGLAVGGYMVVSAWSVNVIIARNMACLVPLSSLVIALGLRRSLGLRVVFLVGLLLYSPVFCKSLSMFGYIDRGPLKHILQDYCRTELVVIDKDMMLTPPSWFPDALTQAICGPGYERVHACYPERRTAPQLLTEMFLSNQKMPRDVWVITVDESRMRTLMGYDGVRRLGPYEVRMLAGTHTYGSVFYGTGCYKVFWMRVERVAEDHYQGWDQRRLNAPHIFAPIRK